MSETFKQRGQSLIALLGIVVTTLTIVTTLASTHMSLIWLTFTVYLILGGLAYVLRRSPWFKQNEELIAAKQTAKPIRAGVDLRPVGPYNVLTLICIGVSLSFASTIFMRSLASAQEKHLTDSEVVVVMLFSPLIGPIVEELLVRGLVYKVMRRGWGIVVSSIVSAAIFSAAHGTTQQAVYTFVMGIILALVYETSGRLRDPIIIHVTHNIVAVAIASIPMHDILPGPLNSIPKVVSIVIWSGLILGIYERTTIANDKQAGYRETNAESNT